MPGPLSYRPHPFDCGCDYKHGNPTLTPREMVEALANVPVPGGRRRTTLVAFAWLGRQPGGSARVADATKQQRDRLTALAQVREPLVRFTRHGTIEMTAAGWRVWNSAEAWWSLHHDEAAKAMLYGTENPIRGRGRLCCPHCGNCDPSQVEDNGEPLSSPYLALLCVARVHPDQSIHLFPEVGEDGLTVCGMQWEPNAR